MRRALVVAVLGYSALLLPAGGDEPKAEDVPEYVARFRALKNEFEDAERALSTKWDIPYDAATTDGERSRIAAEYHAEFARAVAAAAKAALDIAEPHAAEPPAAEVLAWVALRSGENSDSGRRAAEFIVKYHAFRPGPIDLGCRTVGPLGSWAERILRAARAAPELPRDQVGRVTCYLATCLMNRAGFVRTLNAASADDIAEYERYSSPRKIAELRKLDPAKLEGEAVALYAETEANYAAQMGGNGRACGELAKAALFEFRHLAVGRTVPETEGEDSAGAKFKLADYRGKVVLLVFWASWCGPCMAQVPHERELAVRYAGRPFAIVGVNGDSDRAVLKAAEGKNAMAWRSFWDGPKSPDGPIRQRWNVQHWPTAYLIDHTGTIRCKEVTRGAFDAKIAELVADAEKAAAKE